MTAKKHTAGAPTNPSEPNEWQTKAAEYLAGWQRTQADFANYQKRNDDERQAFIQRARLQGLLQLAPVLNDVRRARTHLPTGDDRSAWLKGLEQIEHHFLTILRQAGLAPIDDVNRPFDPKLHEAIAYEEHPELDDGSVIDVVEIGWQTTDRVFQPAKVRVSKGKASS